MVVVGFCVVLCWLFVCGLNWFGDWFWWFVLIGSVWFVICYLSLFGLMCSGCVVWLRCC